MKRFAIAVATCATVLVAGCLGEAEYNRRLEGTLTRLKYEKTLDTFLGPPETAKFKENQVYLRPAMPLARDPQLLIQLPQGVTFDLAESFSGAATSDGQPAALPIRLLVFSSFKKPPAAATKKKAQQAPAPAQRDKAFEPAVRSLLATTYGNPDVVGMKSETVNARGRSYKRIRFNSGSGNAVRAYFYDGGNHNVALVVDVPGALANSKTANKGTDYMLESMSVGNAATAAFDGRSESSTSSGAAF